MKTKFLKSLIIVLFLFSCSASKQSSSTPVKSSDKLLVAVSWFQHSSEMTALFHQGFNLARFRLDETLSTNNAAKPLAVVVDIDETMLDNSPFETTLVNNEDFQTGWYEWTNKASAKPLPGALEFAKYAESKGVEIFYITNRDDNERLPTLKNLKNAGFPFADETHLLTKSDLSYSSGNTSSKEMRRNKVAEKFEIILLIGDNLNDFSVVFEDRSINNGKEAVNLNRDQFGKKFIVLPNPMYGAWEKPLYDYEKSLTEDAKTDKLKSKLRTE